MRCVGLSGLDQGHSHGWHQFLVSQLSSPISNPPFFCLYSMCIVYQLSPVLIILSMFTDGCHIAVVKTYQGEKDRSKCLSFDVVFFFLFCCRLLSCLMLLARTELHSQDMINEKLQKAEELGMESFPYPLGLLLDDF